MKGKTVSLKKDAYLHVDLEEGKGRLKGTLVCKDYSEEGRKKAEGESFCCVVQMWQETRTKILKAPDFWKALGVLVRVKGKAVGDR